METEGINDNHDNYDEHDDNVDFDDKHNHRAILRAIFIGQ
jgi:hypothetical protein